MKQDPFINNPELKRNAWLELSSGRLIAMPVILSAVFLLVFMYGNSGSHPTVAQDLRSASMLIFVLIVTVWGSKRASEAVISELNDKTWDCQRLTLISPWVMSIGKLFGSTMYNWYGGGICLIVYVYSSLQLPEIDRSLKSILLLVLISIFLHAFVISMSLIGVNKNRDSSKVKSTFYFLMALVIGGYLAYHMPGMFGLNPKSLYWYGMEFQVHDFSMVSIFFFTIWSVTGLYRNMRTELQFRNGPWIWYGFLLFLIIYCMGFVTIELYYKAALIVPVRFYVAFVITLSIIYYMVFSESKYIVDFRQLIDYFRTGQYQLLLHAAPIWLLTLFVAIPIAVLGVLLYIVDPYFSIDGDVAITYPLVLLGFLVRDICFILYMNLAEKSKRADITALVYLLLFYALIPGILKSANLDEALILFLPDPVGGFIAIVPIFMQVAVMFYLLSNRYTERNKAIEQGASQIQTEKLPPA